MSGAMARTLAIACFVTVIALPAALAARQSTYRAAVDVYRTSPNLGIEQMLALGETERAAAIEHALNAVDADAWSADELAAAAMMHTDAALYFLSRKEPGLPHLDAAEKFIVRLLASETARAAAFVRRWYLTTEAILMAQGDGAAAEGLAVHFRDRFKDRPQFIKALDAYRRGVIDELDGCEKGEFLTVAGFTDSGGHHVQRYFVPAARNFQTALVLEPDLAEAALHLGRIRMLEGNNDEAATLFEQAAKSGGTPTRYLALLFLGSMDERASRWDAAEERYRRADAMFRKGQSAALALAQLLDRRGRASEGTQLLERTLARPVADVVDPWPAYFTEAHPDARVRLRLLRAETSK